MIGIEAVHKVKGEGEGVSFNKPGFVPEETPIPKSQTEIERAYEIKAREYVDWVIVSGKMNRFLGEDVSIRIGESGSGFYYDSVREEINLDPLWFMERGLSPKMIEWAMYHEGRHTIDRSEDTEEFDATLAYCISKARASMPRMLEKWKQALDLSDPAQKAFFESLSEEIPLDPELPERAPRVIVPLVKIYFTTLFNSLDDIWVNKGIPATSHKFEEGEEGGREVQEMYRTTLFPGTDFRHYSHVEQFAHTLLREAMVPHESVQVSDVVLEELTAQRKYLGKSITAKDVVEQFIVPQHGRDTSHGVRRTMIERYLIESFDRMVSQDIEAWTPQYSTVVQGMLGQGEGVGVPGAGQPFDAVIDRQKQREVDHFSRGDRKKIRDVIRRGKKKKNDQAKNAKLTPEERAKAQKNAMNDARAQRAATEDGVFNQPKYNEIKRSLNEYERRVTKVSPHIEALARLWSTLIGKGRELRMARERFHRHGNVDIQAFIAQYPALMNGEVSDMYEPLIFEKRVGEYIENITPEEIRVYLNLDLSGSMKDDHNKMNVLKDLTVLLNEAFRQLQTMVRNEKSELHDEHPFRVSFVVRGYDEKCATLLSADNSWVDEALLMSELDTSGGGGTNSSTALVEVMNDVCDIDLQDVERGKIRTILFDITDGETGGAEEAASIVEKLRRTTKMITNPLYLATQKLDTGEADPGQSATDQIGFETMKLIYGDDAEMVTLETVVDVLTRRLEHELNDIAI